MFWKTIKLFLSDKGTNINKTTLVDNDKVISDDPLMIIHLFLPGFFHYIYYIIFANIPKMNSIITSVNRNNSNTIKTQSFLH